MKSKKVYVANGGGDEQYTPKKTVEALLPYIQHLKGKIIWCPFDRDDSQFVQVLKKDGFSVVNSHIDYGQDFLKYQPKKWDVIISNPPYKNKKVFWNRCIELGKPFALLLPVNIFSDSILNSTMEGREDEIQMIVPDKRTRFYNALTGEVGANPTFKAVYIGVNIFKQNLKFVKL